MKDGWNANGHAIPIKQFHYERKTVMNRILNIVLILALVLLPFTPMNAYADQHEPDNEGALLAGLAAVAAVLIIGWLVVAAAKANQFSDNGDDQETLLAEQLERLKPIDNVGPQTNFTPTENANVHGAMYPVFEW